ncbi:MAG TPA: START domain-containing protein [Puia sp.]|nr:START domain-containing protein [Puia sp.]
MKRNILYLLLLFQVMHFPGLGQNNWVLKKEKDSIRVYNRSNEHSKFNDLRVETILKSSLSCLAAVILDIKNYSSWAFNTKTAYVLKQVSSSELYFYSEINSPWPASNRDLAVHLHIMQDPVSKLMHITADEVPNFIPQKENIVRVPLSRETWKVKALDKTTIRIEYELQIDPGASAPAWLINNFAIKGPYETFKHLREQIKLPKYQNISFPFIVN